MRKFQHSKQKSFLDSSNGHEESSFLLKIICADGVVVSDRLVFILWSKQLRQLLDPDEETSVLIFPDVKQRSMELLLNLLRKGNTSGYESDFEDLFELAIEFFEDFPGGFSNFGGYQTIRHTICGYRYPTYSISICWTIIIEVQCHVHLSYSYLGTVW